MDDAVFGQVGQQVLGRPAARRLGGRQVEGERPTVAIGDGVDLGIAAASTAADRLRVSPPLPPAGASTSNTPCQTPFGGPAHVAIVERLRRPVDGQRILPAAARLEHMRNVADYPAVVHLRHTPRLVRQQRLQPNPLLVAQPELARYPALRLKAEAESHPGRRVNPVYGSRP